MQLLCRPFSIYETNCYILKTQNGEFIIDPGEGATNWVKENVKKPLAILCTHGHWDHTWSCAELQKELKTPVYINEQDKDYIANDLYQRGVPKCKPNLLVKGNKTFNIKSIEIKFHFFPGHTPGCSMIEIDNFIFSGDFLFKDSIGRTDLPFSNPKQMIESLKKFKQFPGNKTIYPGHRGNTTVKAEQKNIDHWLDIL